MAGVAWLGVFTHPLTHCQTQFCTIELSQGVQAGEVRHSTMARSVVISQYIWKGSLPLEREHIPWVVCLSKFKLCKQLQQVFTIDI